jgi:hypothetical protein
MKSILKKTLFKRSFNKALLKKTPEFKGKVKIKNLNLNYK